MDGKQLRNSILQWAIQGKLVPQDPNDEPASVLLERIREEKARLVKEKKIKRDKNESIIYRGDDNSYYEKFIATGEVKCIDDEIPFDLPNTWCWVRLDNVITLLSGRDLEPSQYNNLKKGMPYMTGASNFLNDELIVNRWTLFPATISHIGELLITCKGTIGTMAFNAIGDIHIARQIMSISSSFINLNYLKLFLEVYVSELEKAARSIIPGISRNDILKSIFPVPPLNEQARIVEFINGITPSISLFGKKQTELIKLNDKIKPTLKKSILQEAIQGRLVVQCETDEPASVLLEKIRAEKKSLIKNGKLKKSALEDSVIFKGDDNKYYENLNGEVIDITDQIPFDIPTSWQWVRLRTLCNIATGASFKKEEASIPSANKVRVLRGGNIQPFMLQLKGDDIFINRDLVNENILLRQNDLVTPAVTSLENICKMARIEQDYADMTMGGFVFIIRGFYNDNTLSHYLQCVFSTPTTIEFVRSITNKSGQAFYNIGKERLSNTLIPIPPFDEMGRITSKIDTLFQSFN